MVDLKKKEKGAGFTDTRKNEIPKEKEGRNGCGREKRCSENWAGGKKGISRKWGTASFPIRRKNSGAERGDCSDQEEGDDQNEERKRYRKKEKKHYQRGVGKKKLTALSDRRGGGE